MPSKRFDFEPIPQPAAPQRDKALTASSDGSRELTTARLVPTALLEADSSQPRRAFSDESLHELAASLRAQGMRQPITAYYDDKRERFILISGERRLRAANLAGMAEVPVLVEHRPTSEGDKLVLQLAENLVREDLTALEAAGALGRLKELRPKDWDDVAARHGIGKRRAYQYLQLLEIPALLREALAENRLSEGHVAELRRVPIHRLPDLVREIVEHQLSVADTRALLREERAEPPSTIVEPAAATPPTPPRATPPALAADASARASAQHSAAPAEAAPTSTREAAAPAAQAPDRTPRTTAPTLTRIALQPTISSTGEPTITPPAASSPGLLAGSIASTIDASPTAASDILDTAPSRAATLREEKARRMRARRLRQRLERIASELRNVHMDEVVADLNSLPELIVEARRAHDNLAAFIALLERVQLDGPGAMERPPA